MVSRMRTRGMRAVVLVTACLALATTCSDQCADVAASLPPQDPTACGAGGGACPAELYCVTDAGPSVCVYRKLGGEKCETRFECYSNVCEPGGECAEPKGCGS
jgi:hypothetical protein